MTEEQRQILIKAQQGEVNAALMYQRLADLVRDRKIAEQLRLIGREEGKHGSIFYRLTNEKLQVGDREAKAITMIYRIIGAKLTFKFLAAQEMSAAKRYAEVMDDFHEMVQIRLDEENHSGILEELSKKAGYRC